MAQAAYQKPNDLLSFVGNCWWENSVGYSQLYQYLEGCRQVVDLNYHQLASFGQKMNKNNNKRNYGYYFCVKLIHCFMILLIYIEILDFGV